MTYISSANQTDSNNSTVSTSVALDNNGTFTAGNSNVAV